MKHFLSLKYKISNRVNGDDIEYLNRDEFYEVEDAYNTLGHKIDLSNGVFTFNNGVLEYKHNNDQKEEPLSYIHLYDNNRCSTRVSPSYVDQIDISFYRRSQTLVLVVMTLIAADSNITTIITRAPNPTAVRTPFVNVK